MSIFKSAVRFSHERGGSRGRDLTSSMVLLLFLCLATTPVFARETPEEVKCAQGAFQDDSGICGDLGKDLLRLDSDAKDLLQPYQEEREGPSIAPAKKTASRKPQRTGPAGERTFHVYFFWGKGCPHCEQERRFLDEIKKECPTMNVKDFEVWYDKRNASLLSALLNAQGVRISGVPITFVDGKVFSGFSKRSGKDLEATLRRCCGADCIDPGAVLSATTDGAASAAFGPAGIVAKGENSPVVDIPLIGALDARDTSLPVLTVMIAALDSFNPCAFFVLLSLLGLLVHAQSRNKMLLIGGVFVFFSGFIYFLFMAAWLNLFLVMGQVAIITTIAGGVSVMIAVINIKDFFLFKRGLSLSLPDSAKPRLFDRMRKLMRAGSLLSLLAGTTVLALVANSYELLCTAGFPMVFTRIMTLRHLSTSSYYLYLALYNVVYVIPLLLIVLMFSMTLGSRKLTEWQGRVLKLVSGAMMLGLGGVLLANPAVLNSVSTSFIILSAALGVSLFVAMVTKRLEHS